MRRAVLLILLLPVVWASPVARAASMVRWDWHFRESLRAIRGWEAILAAWEKQTPEKERTPVLPVPLNGEAVEWPNPIPKMLLPPGDRASQVRVRLVGGKIDVQHGARDSKGGWHTQTRLRVQPGATVLGTKHPGGGGKSRWYHRY
ncbi:hypothetical protein HQ576_19025, partial [bacterium]|nr:hypothetical protein [bacterium]